MEKSVELITAELQARAADLMGQAALELRAQAAEIARLETALKRANALAEHFEREWYLCTDALEALLACPSGQYCEAYPAAEAQARERLAVAAQVALGPVVRAPSTKEG